MIFCWFKKSQAIIAIDLQKGLKDLTRKQVMKETDFLLSFQTKLKNWDENVQPHVKKIHKKQQAPYRTCRSAAAQAADHQAPPCQDHLDQADVWRHSRIELLLWKPTFIVRTCWGCYVVEVKKYHPWPQNSQLTGHGALQVPKKNQLQNHALLIHIISTPLISHDTCFGCTFFFLDSVFLVSFPSDFLSSPLPSLPFPRPPARSEAPLPTVAAEVPFVPGEVGRSVGWMDWIEWSIRISALHNCFQEFVRVEPLLKGQTPTSIQALLE